MFAGHNLPVAAVEVNRNEEFCFWSYLGYGVVAPGHWVCVWFGYLVESTVGHAHPPLVFGPWDVVLVRLGCQYDESTPGTGILFDETILF